jgi:hypothetical protein
VTRRAPGLALLAALLATGWSCTRPQPPGAEAAAAHFDTTAPSFEPPALRTVYSDPAYQRTGPGGRPFDVASRTAGSGRGHSRSFGTKTFEIAIRAVDVTATACGSCHVGATILDRERVGDAHQNVQPVHPAETAAACSSCHDARNVERLVLRSGATATADEAYRLCAQCHFGQVEAWAGGAHGKRLDGWRGRRVVMACTDCHDPHKPAIGKRIPFPGPRLPGQHD